MGENDPFLLEVFCGKRKPYWVKSEGQSWKALSYYLKDNELLRYWSREDKWLGMAMGESTCFIVLDIDRKDSVRTSPYNNPESIKAICELFEEYNILLYPFRSSPYSEGIHLIGFLDKPANSFDLGRAIRAILQVSGYELGNGILELYPDIKANGELKQTNLRLPFQLGCVPLDNDLIPECEYKDATEREKALFWYFKYRYTKLNDIDSKAINELVSYQNSTSKQSNYGLKEFRQGKKYLEGKGLSRFGERTRALKQILYYLKKSKITSFGKEEKQLEIAWNWLQNNHNGNSKSWNEEGSERCYEELKKMIFGRFDHDPMERRVRGRAKYNHSIQEEALCKIEAVVLYILETEGTKAIVKKNGSSLNMTLLAEKMKEIKQKARNDPSFIIPGLKNSDLWCASTRATLNKHSDRLHDLWLKWEESQTG